MKKLFPLLLLFLAVNCYAQNKPVVIYPKMFVPPIQGVPLSKLDGWYFRVGNDTTWAKKDVDITGWQKLSPASLSAKYANKSGRVEGWFRIKIKLDNTVKVKGLSIHYGSYAPADIYLNGKLFGSVGTTGLYGHPYAEYHHNLFDPGLPLDLKQGEQFTLAMHIVDSLAPIVPGRLKSEWKRGSDVIVLFSKDSEHLAFIEFLNASKRSSFWLWISLTLCVLSWLLAIQNHREKVLFLIAGCSTFFVLYNCSQSSLVVTQMPSCRTYIIYFVGATSCVALIVASIPVVIAEVFKRRILLWVKITLALFTFYLGAGPFLPSWIPDSVSYLSILFPLVVSLYYIISSWKNLRGAQWSIVAGLLATFFFLLSLIIAPFLLPEKFYRGNGIVYFLFTGFLLSFPASLLVYVAMRFKEIVKEVRHNAAQVVRLSEEKKQEALNRQKVLEEEVKRQTAEIRANQARLIQSEKMASLGELTAGIAHEIQNPLNFVNNFSEVNQEMLEELKAESAKPKAERDEQLEQDLIADLIDNEQKINHHGKRADAIVKGMLEHSRTSTGERQVTNINVLADEFLKLSYHGLRAKDKNFNADFATNFDPNLPQVNVVQQDIGRVLINLFSNAFYAVNQKAKTAGSSYKPTVEVSTAQQNGSVVVCVKDNGNGIPGAIKDKIMQPFFTTKPTGEGTGLGLSLSYDIVVKGHEGSIDVDTKESEYTEFMIRLPL